MSLRIISSIVVSAIISPLSITITLSTSQCSTSSNLCSIMIAVLLFCFCILSINSIALSPVAGSKLAKGSSNKSIFTSSTVTPAKVTLCF